MFAIWLATIIFLPKYAFSEARVAQALGDKVSGEAHFQSFRHVFFPHPGCVAEGVTIRTSRDNRVPPLISVAKLTIIGNYSTIFSKRVAVMKAEGLQVAPSGGPWPESRSKDDIVIEHLVADNAVLQVFHQGDGPALKFLVRRFALRNLGSDGPMPFHVEVANPIPPGEISANGKLGPWKKQHADTPIEGSYTFRNADLSAIDGIGGILSSDGKFHGNIRELQVAGATTTPEFEVKSNHHRFPVATKFNAQVNAVNGDVFLQRVDAKLGQTDLSISGAVVGDGEQHRRTATLSITTHNGRIQDILFPFVKAPRSPVVGQTSWRARVVLPGGNEPFRQRVRLTGDFGIDDAHFTSPHTQTKIDKASEDARGNPDDSDPADVVSDLKGHVDLKNGTAAFSQLSFAVPGALARMHGTYNIINERVDLHGAVEIRAKLSDATTGFKSFLIKALNPFIKKDKPREPLPVAITGTYDHPKYSVSVTKKQEHHGM